MTPELERAIRERLGVALLIHPAPVPEQAHESVVSLMEHVYPKRWEHLGGPLSWYRVRKHRKTESGIDLYIDFAGTVGTIAGALHRSISREGRPVLPARAYLLHGPAGVGKTMFIRLLAATYIAERWEPVTVETPSGAVRFFSAEDGKPIVLNPVGTDAIVRDVLHRGDTQHPRVRLYNAGASEVNKEVLSDMLRDLKQPTLFTGRRVFVVSELDQLAPQQGAAFKAGLDPAVGLREGNLVLADTNSIETVRSRIAEAVARFTVIPVRHWEWRELAAMAGRYMQQLGLRIDVQKVLEEIATRTLAEEELKLLEDAQHDELRAALVLLRRLSLAAGGSLRELLRHLGSLVQLSRPVTLSDIEALEVQESDGVMQQRLLSWYLEPDKLSETGMAEFCRRMASMHMPLESLYQALFAYLTAQPGRLKPETARPWAYLMRLLAMDRGVSVWIAAQEPLLAIRRLIGHAAHETDGTGSPRKASARRAASRT